MSQLSIKPLKQCLMTTFSSNIYGWFFGVTWPFVHLLITLFCHPDIPIFDSMYVLLTSKSFQSVQVRFIITDTFKTLISSCFSDTFPRPYCPLQYKNALTVIMSSTWSSVGDFFQYCVPSHINVPLNHAHPQSP